MNATIDKDHIITYLGMLKNQIKNMETRLNTESYTSEHEEVEELIENLKIKYENILDEYAEKLI